jgi:hypothetical protein
MNGVSEEVRGVLKIRDLNDESGEEVEVEPWRRRNAVDWHGS